MASIAHFPARRNAIKKERFLFSLFPVHLLIRYAHLPASRADARLLRFVSDWISEHLSVKDDHFLSPALKSANQLSLASSSGLSLMRMPSYIVFFCIRAALRVFPHRVQRPLVPQQRIQRHTEDFGKHQQLFRFRQRNIRLPFGNGLPGDGAALRHLLLRHAAAFPKPHDLFRSLHFQSPLCVFRSFYPIPPFSTNRQFLFRTRRLRFCPKIYHSRA